MFNEYPLSSRHILGPLACYGLIPAFQGAPNELRPFWW